MGGEPGAGIVQRWNVQRLSAMQHDTQQASPRHSHTVTLPRAALPLFGSLSTNV